MLIDDRSPPPSGSERPLWEPDLRLCAWIAAAVTAWIACGLVDGFASFVILCAAVGLSGQAVALLMPDTFGLKDHRQ